MMLLDILYIGLGLVGGYILGSIPFGLVFTKMAGLGDIRKTGSGNIGATNVLRTGRKDLALMTLICDSGKGAFAVLILSIISPYAAVGAALGSVLGHLYPVWLNFKGGKGVATTLGVLLALLPPVGILTCALWLVTAFFFRMSSLSALIAVAAAPFFAGIMYGEFYALVTLVIAALVWVKHKDNIDRIMHGTEPKIGEKK
jgi:glycerol-3-phosphate acyltransferase PlsY